MKITTFKQAKQFLYNQIPSTEYRFPGELGLNRTKYLLKLLGNPQNKLKVIHIAGTSGKGSTAYLISSLLLAHGFKVGLHISPHLTDIRERIQINNELITEKEFTTYVNKLIPVIEEVRKSSYGTPSYFEIQVAMAYLLYFEKRVDYAVMATGLG